MPFCPFLFQAVSQVKMLQFSSNEFLFQGGILDPLASIRILAIKVIFHEHQGWKYWWKMQTDSKITVEGHHISWSIFCYLPRYFTLFSLVNVERTSITNNPCMVWSCTMLCDRENRKNTEPSWTTLTENLQMAPRTKSRSRHDCARGPMRSSATHFGGPQWNAGTQNCRPLTL